MNPQSPDEVFALARTIVEQTDTNLFLTGKAGTGKTTFLRRLRAESSKRMVVLAPTGIAAINAGGSTLHSFFQLPFAPFVPGARYKREEMRVAKQKIKLIRSLDLIVIDEISMVSADLLDAVDARLQFLRRNSKPFGGVQLLLIGDLCQLAPVVKEEEWNMLRQHYTTPYFFSSHAYSRSHTVVIELQHVFRQRDAHFISLLNAVRTGQATPSVLQQINSRYIPDFRPAPDAGYITLVTHNTQAQRINDDELAAVAGPSEVFEAKVEGRFPEFAYPTDYRLTLKVGAQVMFVKNDPEKRYFNGMLGRVAELKAGQVIVTPNDDPDHGVHVEPAVWENMRYELDVKTGEITEQVEGSFMQLPLKLAWAITIHKSQGLTFDRVVLHAAWAFAHGQTYVALSRCRTLEGIVLAAPIPPSAVITDSHVSHYMEVAQQTQVGEAEVQRMQSAYAMHLMGELFGFERERMALGAVVRQFDENLALVFPDTCAALREALQQFDNAVMNVAGRFRMQYEGPTPVPQERIRNAAGYFAAELSKAAGALEELPHGDNKQVTRLLVEAEENFHYECRWHLPLLLHVHHEGFTAADYIKQRAHWLLEAEKGETAAAQTKRKAAVKVPAEVRNAELYQRLVAWRRSLMQERQVPAYTILPTTALIQISNYGPSTTAELLTLKGVGRVKVKDYGDEILQLLQTYRHECEEKGQPLHFDDDAPWHHLPPPKVRTEVQSLERFKRGLSPERIAEERGLKVDTIEAHLASFIPTGQVNLTDLVTADELQAVRRYLAQHTLSEGYRLTDIMSEVQCPALTFNHLRLILQYD